MLAGAKIARLRKIFQRRLEYIDDMLADLDQALKTAS
jgi:hypothetical protein